jgi:hypothetical protein
MKKNVISGIKVRRVTYGPDQKASCEKVTLGQLSGSLLWRTLLFSLVCKCMLNSRDRNTPNN